MSERLPSQSNPHSLHQDDLREKAVQIMRNIETHDSTLLPEGFSFTNSLTSLFSFADFQKSALDVYHAESDSKLFVLKSGVQEYPNTQKLIHAGVKELLPLLGEIQTEESTYVFGSVPASAVNIQTFSYTRASNAFDMNDVMEQAAKIIASIHSRGYSHGDFELSHLIVTADIENPLLLYRNHIVNVAENEQEKNHDIETFIASLDVYKKDLRDQLQDNFYKAYGAYNSLWKK